MSTIRLWRGDKWVRAEAGSEMERRCRAKGFTDSKTEKPPPKDSEEGEKGREPPVSEDMTPEEPPVELAPEAIEITETNSAEIPEPSEPLEEMTREELLAYARKLKEQGVEIEVGSRDLKADILAEIQRVTAG